MSWPPKLSPDVAKGLLGGKITPRGRTSAAAPQRALARPGLRSVLGQRCPSVTAHTRPCATFPVPQSHVVGWGGGPSVWSPPQPSLPGLTLSASGACAGSLGSPPSGPALPLPDVSSDRRRASFFPTSPDRQQILVRRAACYFTLPV